MVVAAAWVVSQRNKAASSRKSTDQIDEFDATTATGSTATSFTDEEIIIMPLASTHTAAIPAEAHVERSSSNPKVRFAIDECGLPSSTGLDKHENRQPQQLGASGGRDRNVSTNGAVAAAANYSRYRLDSETGIKSALTARNSDFSDASSDVTTSTMAGTLAPNNRSRPWTPAANVECRVGLAQFVESTSIRRKLPDPILLTTAKPDTRIRSGLVEVAMSISL